jgi:hypothetical protein
MAIWNLIDLSHREGNASSGAGVSVLSYDLLESVGQLLALPPSSPDSDSDEEDAWEDEQQRRRYSVRTVSPPTALQAT